MAPQSLHVLRCFSCKTFQVHIVKKSNKWQCKLCFSKQSIQNIFGTGTGIECRNLVQQLNLARGEVEAKIALEIQQDSSEEDEEESEIPVAASLFTGQPDILKRTLPVRITQASASPPSFPYSFVQEDSPVSQESQNTQSEKEICKVPSSEVSQSKFKFRKKVQSTTNKEVELDPISESERVPNLRENTPTLKKRGEERTVVDPSLKSERSKWSKYEEEESANLLY